MKNNRLTNKEIETIRESAQRISELASLQNTSFSNDPNEDRQIKDAIRLWLQWFNSPVNIIEEILNSNDK